MGAFVKLTRIWKSELAEPSYALIFDEDEARALERFFEHARREYDDYGQRDAAFEEEQRLADMVYREIKVRDAR